MSRNSVSISLPAAERGDFVGIVIVTYNRLPNLRVALEACLRQEGDIRLFVVNNASTDGTGAYLAQVSASDRRITVLNMARNSGGAGGFAHGMEAACAAGCTWLWLMDDDVVPLPGALQTLLRYGDKARCIYPAKVCADGRLFAFEGRISRRTLLRIFVHNTPELQDKGCVGVNSGNFEGALVHRDVVAVVGTPDPRFFICWDDTLFGIQAAETFPCIYIRDVCMRKQFDKERLKLFGRPMLTSTVFSRYYFFRNYWFVMRYLRAKQELSPAAYFHYAYSLSKTLLMTLVFDRDPNGVLKIIKGAWSGYRGRFAPF